MFDDFTDQMLFDLAAHLAPSSEPYQLNSERNCVHILATLQSCLQQVVTELSQISDVRRRQDWHTVYLGLESMSSLVAGLNTDLETNT